MQQAVDSSIISNRHSQSSISSEINAAMVFPFLKLPQELRDKIYREALISGFVSISAPDKQLGLVDTDNRFEALQPVLNLFRVNRQMYQEASITFEALFVVDCYTRLHLPREVKLSCPAMCARGQPCLSILSCPSSSTSVPR